MSIETVASNFPPTNIAVCFSLVLASLWPPEKNKPCFPGPSYLKLIVLVCPRFTVPTQTVQTLSPLTFPQWQGSGVQTKAALHSAHSLSCLWQIHCMLCALVLAADQGNPTVLPWWKSSSLPRPLCIPVMAVNSSTPQERRFERHSALSRIQRETDIGKANKSLTPFLHIVSVRLVLVYKPR